MDEVNKTMDIVQKYSKWIQEKTEQTSFKIKFVTKYVENWLRVLSRANFCSNLNFIDCMCNAGIYADGDFCTAFHVLKLFKNYAYQFPNKTYSLYLNDISKERIEIFTILVKTLFGDSLPENIIIYKNNVDVNDYLKLLTSSDNLFTYPNATLLYVDPYNLGTVHIPTLQSFIKKYYCELIFNAFTSDFVRNHMDSKIIKVIDDKEAAINNKNELIDYIISKLKVNKMRYHFAYEFRISTNIELYQIMFLTPSDKGLDELKDALWDTFGGSAFYRNNKKQVNQMSFFTKEDIVRENLKNYAIEARNYLQDYFHDKVLTYKEICDIVLPRSMLKSSHIINALLKPAIDDGYIIKLNKISSKNNYKDDSYQIIRGFER